MTTKTVMMEEAVTHLSELLNLVDQGTEVRIVRENRPTIQLISLAEPPAKRVFGQHRGQVWMSPHFDDPLPDPFGLGEESSHEKAVA